MAKRRRSRGLGALGARLTHVASVRLCPGTEDSCCAHKRDEGPAEKGSFKTLCAAKKLKVIVGGREPQQKRKNEASTPEASPGQTEGLNMARRKHHRRHAALAEYGEPLGDVGFIGDLLDKGDLMDFGKIAAGGLAASVVTPKAIGLLDKLSFIPFSWRPYVKSLASVAGGFAAYKYLGRRVPAKYRDVVTGASAVMAAYGLSTMGHHLFDKSSLGASFAALHGLGDLFPMKLADDVEGLMLAGLAAVEQQALAGDHPGFGADHEGFGASVNPMALEGAWVAPTSYIDDREQLMPGATQGVGDLFADEFQAPGDFDEGRMIDGLDASVSSDEPWLDEEGDEMQQMMAAQ